MIETSQLQTLVAVARAQSFSRAADDLHVTQSAISQSIKNLEKKIQVKLFKRSGKKVVLTPEGEKLHDVAKSYLIQMDDTLEEIKNDKNSMSGKVRVGTLNGVGKSWLAHELLEYSLDNPELTVVLNLGFQEDLVRDFENYRLDFLILPEDSLPSVGERVFLTEEHSTLVFPKSSEFNLDDTITLEQLSSYPTILFEEGDHLYLKWCREKFGTVPKNINVRYIVNSHGNMLEGVQRGLGLAVIPNHVLTRSFYKNKISTLGSGFQVLNGRFYIVYHKHSEKLLRVKNTLDRLLENKNPFSD